MVKDKDLPTANSRRNGDAAIHFFSFAQPGHDGVSPQITQPAAVAKHFRSKSQQFMAAKKPAQGGLGKISNWRLGI
jgi:hypothetical protein